MNRRYDMTKKSDMARFARDLEKELVRNAEKVVSDKMGNACPKCGHPMKILSGYNTCPFCGSVVRLTIR